MITNDIEVKEPVIVGDTATTIVEAPVDITKLTPADRKELLKQLADQEKAEKNKRKENVETFKKLQSEYLANHIEPLVTLHTKSEALVQKLFKEYAIILDLKKEIYGVSVEKQDSHTITLPDGTASITIGYNVSISFDGTESAGVEKIKNYITTLSGDDEKTGKLTKIVNTLLKPNAKTGMLNPSKIIELSKLRNEFNNDEFNDGIEIIFNAQNRVRNSTYVSGWKFIEVEPNITKKLEFRFTV